MTRQLYEEALADVKKLKEIAEDNAKKALIEAVAPRIKDLIETELLREADDKHSDEENLLLDDGLGLDSDLETEPSIAAGIVNLSGGGGDVASAVSLPDAEGKVTLDLDALKVEPTENEFHVSNESFALLNPLVEKLNEATILQIESKLFKLGESVDRFSNAGKFVKRSQGFQVKISEMVSEVEKAYEYLQESAGNLRDKKVYEEKLEKLYKELNKLAEQDDMKNKKSLLEGDVTLKLTGMPDEIDLDSIGVDLITGEEEEEAGEEKAGEELDLGGEEESEGGEEELDLGGEEEEEKKEEGAHKMESRKLSDNTIVEIDEGMLRREIARMKALREEAAPAAWGDGPGDVSDEFADDDLGDPFVDVELTTESDEEQDESSVYELDELDSEDEEEEEQDEAQDMDEQYQAQDEAQDMYEADEDEDEMDEADMDQAKDSREMGGNEPSKKTASIGSNKQDRSPGKTMEGISRRITSERNVQLEAKKKAVSAKKAHKEAKAKSKKAQLEAQQAAKKGQKGTAMKKAQEARSCASQAKKMAEAYTYFATKFNESVQRTNKLKTMLAEAAGRNGAVQNGALDRSAGESENLHKKLAETNLFNTKLLYTNKLLQNESLTKRQKADVIERLDEARSEREVKLVYESLVKTLAGSSRPLAEGAQRRVLGSSSQATRPASTTLNENIEADRWARLAGIK